MDIHFPIGYQFALRRPNMKLDAFDIGVRPDPRLDERHLLGETVDIHLISQVFQPAVGELRPFAGRVDAWRGSSAGARPRQ